MSRRGRPIYCAATPKQRDLGSSGMLRADASMLDTSSAKEDATAENEALVRRPRVVLVQTQAEGAGAQEIARILGNGLKDKDYDIHYVFFFRRTAAFDRQPNTFFCSMRRPADLASLMRMFNALVDRLREL